MYKEDFSRGDAESAEELERASIDRDCAGWHRFRTGPSALSASPRESSCWRDLVAMSQCRDPIGVGAFRRVRLDPSIRWGDGWGAC